MSWALSARTPACWLLDSTRSIIAKSNFASVRGCRNLSKQYPHARRFTVKIKRCNVIGILPWIADQRIHSGEASEASCHSAIISILLSERTKVTNDVTPKNTIRTGHTINRFRRSRRSFRANAGISSFWLINISSANVPDTHPGLWWLKSNGLDLRRALIRLHAPTGWLSVVVVRPHFQNMNDPSILKDFVDQAVLDVDPSG